jgi:hypothetical protein
VRTVRAEVVATKNKISTKKRSLCTWCSSWLVCPCLALPLPTRLRVGLRCVAASPRHIVSETSHTFSCVPKRSHLLPNQFPNASQSVPNPLFIRPSVVYMPFSRELRFPRGSFFGRETRRRNPAAVGLGSYTRPVAALLGCYWRDTRGREAAKRLCINYAILYRIYAILWISMPFLCIPMPFLCSSYIAFRSISSRKTAFSREFKRSHKTRTIKKWQVGRQEYS